MKKFGSFGFYLKVTPKARGSVAKVVSKETEKINLNVECNLFTNFLIIASLTLR